MNKTMKFNRLFFAITGIVLSVGFAGCEDEKEPVIIEGDLPIKTSTLYMVGDATPTGWNIDSPTALEPTAEDELVFQWEGQLNKGEMKLCLTPGSWDAAFIRPVVAGAEISKTNITSEKFAMHAGDPDDKWSVADAGKYRLCFDLRNWTMSTEYLAEPEIPAILPIETEFLFMVGDATPAGWSIDNPTPLTKQSQYIFVFEGTLNVGEMKLCIQTGIWDVPFIRPLEDGCKINKDGVENADFVNVANPDSKWKVEEAGQYRLTFDLENYKITSEYLGEAEAPTKEPIEAEAVYMVGDATPAGWSIDEPTQLTKESQYIFVYEGELVPGEIKLCIETGSWDAPFIRPTSEACQISLAGVDSEDFIFVTNPDNKWKVTESGQYRLVFDLENWTVKVEIPE